MATAADPTSRYEVIAELGKGGMGAVYEVRDRVLDRPAALKVVLGAASDEALERFVREARAGAALEHPALVPTYDLGRAGGELFFTMQLVQGRTLAHALAHEAPAIAEPVRWLAAAARGVAYAHQRGLVHRDLKPANIMVGEQGAVSVLDWGLVAPGTTSTALAPEAPEDGRLTLDGALMGTPAYMSPEQADGRGAQAGPACDVYALGAILYEILAGRPPVEPGPIRDMVEAAARGGFEPPSQRAPGRPVPAALEAVCARAMVHDPAGRYPDALAFATDLEAWLEGRAVSVERVPWTARAVAWVASHPLAVAVALGMGVLVAAAWAIRADLARRDLARAQSYLAAEDAGYASSLREGQDAAGRAAAFQKAWRAAFDTWRAHAVAENAVLVRRPALPPMQPNETVDAFYRRTIGVIQGFDWNAISELLTHRANFVDPAPSTLSYTELLRWREAFRREADAARPLLEGAGRPGAPLPEAALDALITMASGGLEIEVEIAMANDHDWLNPETVAAAGLTRDWRKWTAAEGVALPVEIPPVWRNVIRAMRRLVAALELAGRHPDHARLLDRARARREDAERLLDGREDVVIDPVPAGVEGELLRATFEPLWARDVDGALVSDDDAGLERVGAVGAAGERLVLPPSEYVLRMRRGDATVLQWFLVERGRGAHVAPLFPARFPPGAVLVGPSALALKDQNPQLPPLRTSAGPFFIERTETPLGSYRAFLDDVVGGAAEAPAWLVPKHRDRPQVTRDATGRWRLAADMADDLPASRLSYLAAALYARWKAQRDGWAWRLPTQAEWTLAAAGPSGRAFTWGGTADPRRAPCVEGDPRMAVVHGYPTGRSPVGAHLMAGNVWEHVATPLDGHFVIKIGATFGGAIRDVVVQRIDRSAIQADYQECGIRLVCDLLPEGAGR